MTQEQMNAFFAAAAEPETLTFEAAPDGSFTACGTGLQGIVRIPASHGDAAVRRVKLAYCGEMTGLILPPEVKELPRGALKQCAKLKTLVIGSKQFHISSDALDGCVSLRDVCYPGSRADWLHLVRDDSRKEIPPYAGGPVPSGPPRLVQLTNRPLQKANLHYGCAFPQPEETGSGQSK